MLYHLNESPLAGLNNPGLTAVSMIYRLIKSTSCHLEGTKPMGEVESQRAAVDGKNTELISGRRR